MRPALVRLVDFGLDGDFDVSMSFAQSVIQSLNARRSDRPVAEVEFIRTRDFVTVASALQTPASVIHVMAHGTNSPDELGFWTDDEASGLSLTDLAERFAEDGDGIDAGVVFADCCATAKGRFVRAMRNCIEQPIAYVGAKRSVDWHESTTFGSAFYAAFFKDRGKGLSRADRGLRAATRAVAGYEEIVDGPCPFTVQELTPSRGAKKALAG